MKILCLLPVVAVLNIATSVPSAVAAPSSQASAWQQKALDAKATQVIEQNETVPSVSVLRGPVVVKGTITGDLNVKSGDAYVLGTVQGSVNCDSGDVYVLGRVDHSVNVASGDIYNAGRIGGATRARNGKVVSYGGGPGLLSFSKSYVHSFRPEKIDLGPWLTSAFATAFRFSFALMWLALALLMAAIFPGTIERGQIDFRKELPRSFAIGFVWKLAYWALLVVFVLASFAFIGLPFLAILLITQWALVLLGAPILFLALGRWLLGRAGHSQAAYYLAILIGGGALGLVRLIPFAGDFVWWAAAVLASGLGIRQLLALRIQAAPIIAAPPPVPPAAPENPPADS